MARTLLFLVILATTTSAATLFGQHTTAPYRYMARVEPMTPVQSPKPLFAAIDALVPGSMFSLDPEKKVLRLDSQRELTLAELQNAASSTGFMVLSLERYDRTTGERLVQEGAGNTAFPMFIDTGNERADHARYDAAKAAWISANPDAYDRMKSDLPETQKMGGHEE